MEKLDKKLTLKGKVGYGLGDAGGCLTFALMGSTFSMYCTDALHIDTALLAILLLIWNIWDFVNDPIMGAIIGTLIRSYNLSPLDQFFFLYHLQ